MSDDYKMFCEKCQVLSEHCVGSNWGCHEPELIAAFIKKHWKCRDNIKIVMADVYAFFDYRSDDCAPETVPHWDKLLMFSEEMIEDNKEWEKKWKARMFPSDGQDGN